jgi:hypothetical protein
VGLLSGHASNLEHFQHVLNVVVDLQGAAPESLVIAAAVDDDAEGVDAAVLLVDIDLYVVSVWHNRLQLDFTHPVALMVLTNMYMVVMSSVQTSSMPLLRKTSPSMRPQYFSTKLELTASLLSGAVVPSQVRVEPSGTVRLR